MALSTSSGAQSLINVGMPMGDIATLYGIGRRFGNWVTAVSGDRDFLDLLQEDELEILQRRGILDLGRFNKRWCHRARLLVNGKPTELIGREAERILGELPRFTASMVAVVGALDGFMHFNVLKDVVKRLMKHLLRTTEYGEDVLASQLSDRVNAWRSSAFIRGLVNESLALRHSLVSSKRILDGYMPAGEAAEMARFLFWLLASPEEVLVTSSSDVAAVAYILAHTAFDLLTIEAWGLESRQSNFKLIYTPETPTATSVLENLRGALGIFVRPQCTTVSLTQPEECMSAFPIVAEVANAARHAWNEGRQAANYVQLWVSTPGPDELHGDSDMKYEIQDLGTASQRARSEVYALARHHGLCVNAELCHRLTGVLERESGDALKWLHHQTTRPSTERHITDSRQKDASHINAYTTFQAFFMGYYYEVFMRLVDTSSLVIQAVSGAWGFRSTQLMDVIREHAILAPLTRQNMLVILSALCLSQIPKIRQQGKGQWCLGVVGKRTLLVNSLLSVSDSRQTVAGFQLLDVDVGNIPTDNHGLVRPGEQEGLEEDFVSESGETVELRILDEDLTKHIEPDWDGDPETVLLVLRYKGRRLLATNPAVIDLNVAASWVEPSKRPRDVQRLSNALNCDIGTFLQGMIVWPAREAIQRKPHETVVLVQSHSRPNMRYAAVAAYSRHGVALSSNCIVEAATVGKTVIIA